MQKVICAVLFLSSIALTSVEIPADDPNIQYYGRWDFSDPTAPSHSWPGVYIYAEFEGTSIGVTLNDNFCYYNVIIDGVLVKIFHPANSGISTYNLVSGLTDGKHSILFHKRNETTWTKFSFHGFILDDGKTLLTPPTRPERKIEFIGDSYTSASGNEYDKPDKPPDDAPLTNIYQGFGPITALHYGAQYMITSRSGFGMVVDWQGSSSGNLPDIYDQTHIYTANPPWDFEQWLPNLVVIGLGLNDYSGFGGWSGPVSESNKNLYKTRYHQFIATTRDHYPGVKLLAVAPHVEWLQQTISEIVAEENSAGNNDVFYTFYPYYDDGYVYDGHPNVATHRKIADKLIAAIDQINAWEPYDDKQPPKFAKTPASPFTSYVKDVELSFETDSYATVRYSDHDKTYDQMENVFTVTGRRDHVVVIPCEHGKQYTYYFRAADVKGNMMPESAVISFTVDTSKVLVPWNAPGYDDSGWKSGPAPIGYGSSSGIKSICSSVITAYFKQSVNIPDISAIFGMGLLVKGRDGAVVYLNGYEIGRINFTENEDILYETMTAAPMNMNKMFVINSSNGINYLRNGDNLIAVEMHTSNPTTLGLTFDSQLVDNMNTIYFKLGSNWKYYDAGDSPAAQLIDKSTGVVDETAMDLPFPPRLDQNFPNPFNPNTKIEFYLATAGIVFFKIFTIQGREVAELVHGKLAAGTHQVFWNAGNLPNGVYFYVLQAGNYCKMRKAILLK